MTRKKDEVPRKSLTDKLGDIFTTIYSHTFLGLCMLFAVDTYVPVLPSDYKVLKAVFLETMKYPLIMAFAFYSLFVLMDSVILLNKYISHDKPGYEKQLAKMKKMTADLTKDGWKTFKNFSIKFAKDILFGVALGGVTYTWAATVTIAQILFFASKSSAPASIANGIFSTARYSESDLDHFESILNKPLDSILFSSLSEEIKYRVLYQNLIKAGTLVVIAGIKMLPEIAEKAQAYLFSNNKKQIEAPKPSAQQKAANFKQYMPNEDQIASAVGIASSAVIFANGHVSAAKPLAFAFGLFNGAVYDSFGFVPAGMAHMTNNYLVLNPVVSDRVDQITNALIRFRAA